MRDARAGFNLDSFDDYRRLHRRPRREQGPSELARLASFVALFTLRPLSWPCVPAHSAYESPRTVRCRTPPERHVPVLNGAVTRRAGRT